jgi:hypothetical protein
LWGELSANSEGSQITPKGTTVLPDESVKSL